ncbi:MAG: response regulator transcription factor, partial [Gemmatimonadetes bacterium]|nr:response regulator transcription factor [Gemmatimonadota bacterium]
VLREVASGGFPLARDLAARPSLLCQLVSELQQWLQAGDGRNPAGPAGSCPLTARELVILQMVADGKANKETALTLDITERTVKNHLANIFDKLAARGRAHAVRLAMENGWICTGLSHALLGRPAGREVVA